MPSNSSLAGPPQTAGASTPPASPTAAARPAELDVVQAERQSANARTASASFTVYAQTSSAPGYWIKVPLPRVDRTTLLQELRNADPTAQTRLILAAGHARFAGQQTVQGVVTSRYVASVAPTVALAAVPSALRARLAPYVSRITGDIHYVLWIEPGDYLKQFRVTERAFSSRITLTETINWVNHPVRITIPRAVSAPSQLAGVLASA
jgi:hypothetical protein